MTDRQHLPRLEHNCLGVGGIDRDATDETIRRAVVGQHRTLGLWSTVKAIVNRNGYSGLQYPGETAASSALITAGLPPTFRPLIGRNATSIGPNREIERTSGGSMVSAPK